MNKKAEELANRYNRKSDLIEIVGNIITGQYRVTGFNYPKCAIITSDEQIQVFNWGLIPSWTSTEEDAKEIRSMNLNARADTIFSKPSFREPIISKRCLIPVTGYFEWRHEQGKKIPYYLFLKEFEIFSMAGVYDIWYDKQTESSIITFSIITTETNPLTAYINNTKRRMPAILLPEDEEKWLDKSLQIEDIQALLQPLAMDEMDTYKIKNDFINKSSDDLTILEPLEKK